MASASCDVIGLGAGGVGAAAMLALARRGLRVVGIDRFAPPHDRGSSHGQTRIIRQAYFEHADYVPLLLEAYRMWAELESAAGRQLLLKTGLLEVGPPDGLVVPGVHRAAAAHNLAVESLSAAEIEDRWPSFRVPQDMVGVFEPAAGALRVEECICAHLRAAQSAGAALRVGVAAWSWRVAGDAVEGETSAGPLTAGRLVVAAGPWARSLLDDLELPLQVRRKTAMWHRTNESGTRTEAGFPCYLFERPEGVFYGFPDIDGWGLKAAEHSGGTTVDDPATVDRRLHDEDRLPVERFLKRHLPAAQTPCQRFGVCLYTMSPDENFIVDRHPKHPQVAFAAGLSGHGFKFAPVLGEALADLAVDGASRLPIEFLSLRRLADRSRSGLLP